MAHDSRRLMPWGSRAFHALECACLVFVVSSSVKRSMNVIPYTYRSCYRSQDAHRRNHPIISPDLNLISSSTACNVVSVSLSPNKFIHCLSPSVERI
ncbi:uncharacterized protein B0T23DRAFT_368865 [Neurospora hispaniola]|uniref:Secreted protein n=1 Tax=Neurospora hispaniola TaxID=588809 RepID=A0AAJ0IEL4_9PEZI|nr:hypothetical protein B0T23DRAFT_368865 [Neurospora hispaniola]